MTALRPRRSAWALLLVVLGGAWVRAHAADGGRPTRAEAVMSRSGATLALGEVVKATFPAGSLEPGQRVSLAITSDPSLQSGWDTLTSLWSPGRKAEYEIRIGVGRTQPRTPIVVELQVPPALGRGSDVGLFHRVVFTAELDAHEAFEPLGSRLIGDQRLEVRLTPTMFFRNSCCTLTDGGWTGSGSFEAIVTLAAPGRAGAASSSVSRGLEPTTP